ncbi:methyltransferase regulatory domain-containing protein [Pollutimonas sp. H1-120]|uniref:O-linked N-acetylglucosamine transferase family protein n=1 Tax=Pollutimonas sp. H1-120 TaxID=3148824 RepID=UPI003B51992C
MPNSLPTVTDSEKKSIEPITNSQEFSPFSLTRLRAIAHLYGIETVALEQARTLVVGSGAVGQLIAYAELYPNAEFLGLCNNPAEQAAGTRLIAELGLGNVYVVEASLSQLDPATVGKFDYILVPSLYNKLTTPAAQSALQDCQALLSTLGMLCIGYDVYPGAKSIEVVRDAMLMHSANSVGEPELTGSAKAALTLFTEGLAATGPMAASLRAAAVTLAGRIDAEGIHSVLATEGSPKYFIEFVEQAAKANLAYIGDAIPQYDMLSVQDTSVATANSVLALGQSPLLRLQYLDFSTGRASRHSILVRSDRLTDAIGAINVKNLLDLSWASRLAPIEVPGLEIDTVAFHDSQGHLVFVKDEIVAAMLNALACVWPGSLPVDSLIKAVRKAVSKSNRNDQDDNVRERVLRTLKMWFEGGDPAIQYCLGCGPYDNLQGDGVRLLPSLLFGTKDSSGQISSFDAVNLWDQVLGLQFSDAELEILQHWKQGLKADQIASGILADEPTATEAGQGESSHAREFENLSPKETIAVQNGLLIKLHRAGLLLSKGEAWRDFLYSVIAMSDGESPYWAEYMAALARYRYTTNEIGKEAQATPLPPHLLNQIKKIDSLFQLANYRSAEQLSRQLVEKHPHLPEGWYQLARIQVESKQYIKSLPSFLKALSLAGDDTRIYEYLATALIRIGYWSVAHRAINHALALNPDLPQKNFLFGNLYLSLAENSKAEIYFHREIEAYPENAAAHLNLASSLILQGNSTKAESVLESALNKCAPNAIIKFELINAYLFALNYSAKKTSEDIFSKYKNFDKEIYAVHRKNWRSHKNRKLAGRKINIAYVSPDFNNHAVSKFLEPLISNHDREKFKVYAYANQVKHDAVTERYKSYVDQWLNVLDMDDDALAAQIRVDQIDILVDVAGHTAGSRLAVFARKPAPISVTWLGYGYTTGLSAIDYFLGDDNLCPPGSEPVFSEKPWRLAPSNYVYRTNWESMGEVGALPALTGDGITFGTLTRAIRLNEQVIETWSTILKKLPASRLIVNSANYSDPVACNRLAAQFAEHGIARDRLTLMYESPPWDSLRKMDIGLDCFPHNSGTTLFDTLCMGIPYVTLMGRPGVGGIGASILNGVGHPEWIAHSREEYIEKVLELASDVPRLAHTRLRLRDELKSSPLMDEQGFARKVEDAYRKMFQNWVESKNDSQ